VKPRVDDSTCPARRCSPSLAILRSASRAGPKYRANGRKGAGKLDGRRRKKGNRRDWVQAVRKKICVLLIARALFGDRAFRRKHDPQKFVFSPQRDRCPRNPHWALSDAQRAPGGFSGPAFIAATVGAFWTCRWQRGNRAEDSLRTTERSDQLDWARRVGVVSVVPAAIDL